MKNSDLHGFVPDQAPTVLIILDMISDFEFPQGPQLLPRAKHIARNIARLKERAGNSGIPTIYANDNYGRWRSRFDENLRHCQNEKSRGAEIARLLEPGDNDYIVLKPKHSAFYATALDTLLQHMKADTLIITGVSAHQCVLFTANDAHVRDYKVIVPQDCIASPLTRERDFAVRYFNSVLHSETPTSTRMRLQRRRSRKR